MVLMALLRLFVDAAVDDVAVDVGGAASVDGNDVVGTDYVDVGDAWCSECGW